MLLYVCLLSTCSCDPTIPMFIMGKQHFPWKYLLLAGDCQNCVFCWFIDSYFCISTTILIKSLALLPGNFPYHAEKPSLYRNKCPPDWFLMGLGSLASEIFVFGLGRACIVWGLLLGNWALGSGDQKTITAVTVSCLFARTVSDLPKMTISWR